MRLLLELALSAALVGRPHPIASVEPDSGSVAFTTTTIWLRETPFTGKRVALLPEGVQVRIMECREEACRVEFRRLQGYVAEEQLRTTPARNPVEPGRGYINSRGQWIPSPAHTPDGQPPDGATARCRDGSYSFSQSRRGTCSWHGGVGEWLSVSAARSGSPVLTTENALAMLMAEHRLSIRLQLLESSEYLATEH